MRQGRRSLDERQVQVDLIVDVMVLFYFTQN